MRDDETGEITLKDNGGAEHAQFEGAGAVFGDANPYPEAGERTIKRPIIPEVLLNDDVEPSEEIVTVPEGAQGLDDLDIVIGADDLTVSADAVGRDDEQMRANDLDIPDRAKVLLDLLREDQSGPWTTADTHDVAHDSDDDEIHVGKQAIRKYLKTLADEDVLDKTEGDSPTDSNEYYLK